MSFRATILFVFMVIYNMVYNAFLPLHPDEAYYWVWTKHLQLSYFDHPPMIAYLIKLFTLWGSSEFAIRLVAVVCMSLAIWFIYQLALRLFSERVAEITLLIFFFLPITQIGYGIVTPDSPFILFWSLTIYCLYVGIFEKQKHFIYLSGITAGLMLLSKYTGVILFPGVLLFLLFSKYRNLLAKKDIYLAFLLAIVIFSPVLIWNAQHDWASFRFQFSHGLGEEKGLDFGLLGSFLGAQAAIVNPIFFLALFYYAFRYISDNLEDERLSFLFWTFIFTFGFFAYGALFKKSEANWTVPAYITGVILLSFWLERFKQRWIYYTGVFLTLVLVLMVKFPEVFPFLPDKAVVKSQCMGYDVLFKEGSKYVEDPKVVILSDRYQNASEAWYYLKGQREVYILTPSRISNYDYWKEGLDVKKIKKAVFFGEDDNQAELEKLFKEVKLVDTLHYKNNYVEKEYKVYLCRN